MISNDLVKEATKRQGDKVFAIRPEYAIGPILRSFFRELDNLFQKVAVKSPRGVRSMPP